MAKGYDADLRDVLIAMYGYFLTVDGHAFFHPQELQDKARLKLSSSYIALLLDGMHEGGWVQDNGYEADDQARRFTMTRSGAIEAESEVKRRGLTLDEFEIEFRRTSNVGRVVETDHPYLHEAKAALEELRVHLREDNDVGDMSPSEREVAGNEVDELSQAISKTRVRTHYLWSKAHDVLIWIVEKGAGSMISELAKRALGHIQQFINVFYN